MKRNLLLAGLLTTFSLVAKSQVGINTTNPQGVFNIDGLKNNPTTGVPTAVQAADDLVMTSNGNLGLGLTAPGTTLDVKGAITNRETALAVAGNAVTIPANVSLVRLTGAATANVAISAFAAPNPGQRLIVYNNTTGGFGATLDGTTVPNGKALEFIFSNSFWRSTDGGSAGATPVNLYTADGTLTGNRTVTQGANTLTFTGTQTNAFSVDGATLSVDAANDRLGIGTATPDTKLTISTADGNFGLNHTNGTINLKTYIGAGSGYFGTTTSNNLNLMANNSPKMIITPAGNIGMGVIPDNSALLDVSSTNKGFLLPRVSLTSTTDGATVPSPAKGLMVYNSNTALTPYGEGLYYNSGTAGAPTWTKLSPQKSDFVLSQVVALAATAPVDQAAAGVGNIVDTVNLGLSATVVVPANSTAKILMTYTVPMGTFPLNNSNTVVNGYFGIRFLKNGVEAPEGSRKYSVPYSDSGSHMMSVSGSFSETVVNNGSSPLNVVYTLNGYVEGTVTGTRFNMYASSGDNFNWGKGSLSGTVFAKEN
ncbi:hypothetical protein J2786_002599 [Chryseobacterium vietnamense]|uniref:Uncharacterized protein n=1 Tax=Chryseobacterium vietnamense TaxID=866785 RepID=A0ACC6J9L8_9FLAO|nr:hypothetical protein [Chryseobacterium vietnamense]MDR6459492.1 hypothetical protein [Chryseobacterium vietnamense]